MVSHRPVGRRRAYKTFGWQGVTVTVPAEWELVSTRGRYNAGYVQLADRDTARLELRWEETQRLAPPSETVDAYLARLQKTARKKGTELSVQRNLRLASPVGKDVECYRWVSDRQAVAMLSRCGACQRTVHLHVLGGPGESLKGVARTVFASLRDHPEGGTELWEFFDVIFRTPAELALRQQSLKAGCIRMAFAGRCGTLEFVRASLAEVVLARSSLRQWFEEFYEKALRRRSFRIEEQQIKGHTGLSVEGKARFTVNPLRLFGRRRALRAACWHCDETNRLMICAFDGLKRDAGIFPDALASFRCCEKG